MEKPVSFQICVARCFELIARAGAQTAQSIIAHGKLDQDSRDSATDCFGAVPDADYRDEVVPAHYLSTRNLCDVRLAALEGTA